MLTTKEELLRAPVLQLIEERAECRFTITPGATCLLVVRLERPGHLIVNDETYIRFVDAHSKSICGHDRFQLTGNERFLVLLSLAGLHAPVILLDLEVKTFKPIGQCLDCF